ncbi:MAG: hypothetical protein MK160_10480 [Rhodobacteraceae bacterium]|nr:hypothetical protein [Paracoccaceae bacterium]
MQKRLNDIWSEYGPDRLGSAGRVMLYTAQSVSLVLLTAVSLSADPVTIDYDPSVHRITLTIADDLLPYTDDLPAWLSAGTDEHTYSAILPKIDANTMGRGAAQSGSFVYGLLDWLPASAGVETVRLRVPAPYTGIVTGELVSDGLEEETLYTATFRLSSDPRHTAVFFGPYEISERSLKLASKTVSVRTYFTPRDAALSDAYLDATTEYLREYSDRIGVYALDSYAVVSAPLPVGLAFEGMTYVSENILGHSYMLGRSLAHEVLHSWWGSGVGIDYETGNWAEGLTTYMADYESAERRGADAARSMRRSWLAALTSLPADRDEPLRAFRSSSFNKQQSIGYGKAAMVFHSLRQSLGSPIFDAAVRAFWAENQGQDASWEDVQIAFETASNRDLSHIFAQWLDRPGLPQLSLDTVEMRKLDQGYFLTLTILRDGDYIIETPVVIETQGETIKRRVLINEDSETYSFLLKDAPLAVSLDPGFHSLRHLHESETPVTIGDVLRAGTRVYWSTHENRQDAQAFLAGFLGPAQVPDRVTNDMFPDDATVIAIGTPDHIQSIRQRHFTSDLPQIARDGGLRVWVEKDDMGRIWQFVSSESGTQSIGSHLETLRYYGNQSYMVPNPKGRATSGRWPAVTPTVKIAKN